ncbi:glucokinase [Microbulbifer donghaiensis]|uniref:Glucokinase n=1 Tax=Microbulbifer donghaiensis TaxID=494016 RepID=A0A1M5B5W2_9GAMM|nr:glucokinase [Microbulbifer donghaiensis]SHF37904.1 glucokinase [Microbulbifer donghaiensis]
MQELAKSIESAAQGWKLVADIGGTNARFGLAKSVAAADGAHSEAPVEDIQLLPCAEFERIELALETYLKSLPAAKVADISEACLAVAGPVGADRVAVTNLPWTFSKSGLQQALGYARVEVINDFAALALGCTGLHGDDLVRIDEASQAMPVADTSGELRAVIGPGTGLGVCGLHRSGNSWQALPGEGGHAAIAPVTDEEFAIVQFLRRTHSHVSAEHLLCGRGLVNIFCSLGAVRGQDAPLRDAAAISSAALAGDCALARDAVDTFCNLLGGFCGDVLLILGARGGLYLGGGILPRIEPLLRASEFYTRMRAKGAMSDYLQNVPVHLVRHLFPALAGAAAYLGSER